MSGTKRIKRLSRTNAQAKVKAIGPRARAARIKLGLSAAEAGVRLGTSAAYLNRLEGGHDAICLVRLMQLAAAYGTTIGALVGEVKP